MKSNQMCMHLVSRTMIDKNHKVHIVMILDRIMTLIASNISTKLGYLSSGEDH